MRNQATTRPLGARPLSMGLTLLSALGRLVPHVPNVTPVGSSCLFAGSRVSGIWAYLLPLAVMVATDPFVGGYRWESPLVYASFLISVWIGRQLSGRVTPLRVGTAAFLCSLQFFLLTNFGTWAVSAATHSGMYSADLNGLISCYTLALPFWGRTLAGDLFFSAAIFGVYELLSRRIASTRVEAVA
jgi:hypothetical protein